MRLGKSRETPLWARFSQRSADLENHLLIGESAHTLLCDMGEFLNLSEPQLLRP